MRFRPHPDVVATPVTRDETVLLHMDTQKYFTVNATGAEIWQALSSGLEAEAVAERLAKKFDVSREKARESVDQLVERLLAKELLVKES